MSALDQVDLRLDGRSGDRLLSDRTTVDLRRSASGDVATTTGRENLIQAILNRLFTRRGELARLGHPDYGSRLHELIGEPDNARTRGRLELYLRSCLARERRVAEITALEVAPPSRRAPGAIEVTLRLRPVGQSGELTLDFTVSLEG